MKPWAVAITSLIMLSFATHTPEIRGNTVEWDYTNYLNSLSILSYDDPVTAGQMASITVEVNANTEVVLHIEFKGEFDWGHWAFDSIEAPLDPGVSTVTKEVNVPIKTAIEPASDFYYYIYVTLLGDGWSSSTWNLRQNVGVDHPTEIGHEGFGMLLGHMKWSVYSSQLPEGIKTSTLSKLEAAGKIIHSAFTSGNLNKLNGAVGPMNAFLNELNSEKGVSYPDSDTWEGQGEVIIRLIESCD